MAKDTIGLMDVLGIKSAHLVGASMGGMIAQEIAISFPQRVRSLTSIMSTTGNPKVPPPTREAAADADGAAAGHQGRIFRRGSPRPGRCCASARFPEDEALDRSRAERTFERGLNPAGVGRQLRAMLASGSRKERLRQVKAPTLVIHGTVDPLVRPEGGKDTAASIPGAKLVDDRGHGPRAADPDVAADHRRDRQSTRIARRRRRLDASSSRSRSRGARRRLLPVARTSTSLTSKPAPRRRFENAGLGPDDQTASTPPGRSAVCAAFNPAEL